MQYDIPRLPPRATYVIQKPFHDLSREDCAVNDFVGQPVSEAGDWGGYMYANTSTSVVASGTSISTVRSYEIHFIPTDGVVPSYVMEQQQMRHNLENNYFPKKHHSR